jgi:putative transposase
VGSRTPSHRGLDAASACAHARRERARPEPVPRNLVWGLDLTGKTDTRGQLHAVLGLLDHGTRANLVLAALANKSSFTVLGHLFLAIGRHGKPGAVRTDNESVFASRLFRFVLFALGIRHQKTDTGCPWQNGRIERFFGTLKNKLDRLAVDSLDTLNLALTEFRFFYKPRSAAALSGTILSSRLSFLLTFPSRRHRRLAGLQRTPSPTRQ